MSQEVKGISENECVFQGRVAEDPYVTEQAAYIKLKTIAPEMGANGQIVDTVQTVPITFIDKSKIKVIADYVKKGKQIKVKAYYKAWEADGQQNHAIVATQIKLGPDEYSGGFKGGGGGYNKGGSSGAAKNNPGFPFPQ